MKRNEKKRELREKREKKKRGKGEETLEEHWED